MSSGRRDTATLAAEPYQLLEEERVIGQPIVGFGGNEAALLAAIVESSEDAIVAKDLNGIIRSWNRGAERMFGYTADEVIGKSVTILFPPDHIDEEAGILSRIRRGEPVEHYETVRMRKDGALLDISLTVSPVKNDQGEIIGASKIARDISPRKRVEQALAQANESLERKVQERTASLTEAITQMEEFSYTVSHDVRAPLRAMRFYSGALLEDHRGLFKDNPEALEWLSRIAENCRRLDRMIADVLAYSRVTREEVHLHPVWPEQILEDEVLVEFAATGAEIQIDPLDEVMADEPSLRQILANLVGNAVKFTKDGESAKVRIYSERSDEGRVRLWVEDQGIGIEPRLQHRLFNMFERIHPDLPVEGNGVGLAIVRKAAERLGGEVGVVSDGNSGSRFWVDLLGAPAK